MEIAKETVIQRQMRNLMGGEMGNETVMMDMDTGDYLGLNEVGTSIWKLIEQPITFEALCAQLMTEYDVDAETCALHTRDYLLKLAQENMVTFDA